MRYQLRDFVEETTFSRELDIEAIAGAVPKPVIEEVLNQMDALEQRERKLNMVQVIFILISMNLFAHLSIGDTIRKVAQGLRFVWDDPDYPVPKANALSYRRYQLGAKPLVSLFHSVCNPVATPQTQGAFLFGLRLMAIDATVEDAPDTPENVAAFGKPSASRGEAAFPQVKGVYLVECGTHAIIDAGFWPCRVSERVGAVRMLRSLQPDMLVMWDRGLHDFDMFVGARNHGAHVLSRLPSYVKPAKVHSLCDGSYVAYIYPSEYKRRRKGEAMLVRIIEYTLTDPALPGYGEVHRLITTLLDPKACPALDLVCAYHERWEVEITIDEIDTHQRLCPRTLRSLKPVGVIQELYALLIGHYAVRSLIHDAACQAEVDPDRISFVHALRVIQDAIPEFQMVAPESHPQLHSRLLRDIASGLLPERRNRTNPRVVKRKMSNFHLKREEHRQWPQPSVPFRQAVALI